MPRPALKPASTNCCVKTDPLTVIYGIPNCDKCRNARKWFEQHNIDYRFHDVRSDGITHEMIADWLEHLDASTLINTRSTTWRGLDVTERDQLGLQTCELLSNHPTLLKRPLIVHGTHYSVGYDEARWTELFD